LTPELLFSVFSQFVPSLFSDLRTELSSENGRRKAVTDSNEKRRKIDFYGTKEHK
jgi:hypothetical protein